MRKNIMIKMRRRRVRVTKYISDEVLGSVYHVHEGEEGVMIGRMQWKGEEVRLVVMDNTGYTFYFTIEMVKEYLKFIKPL